jgi:hypothetical protein
MILGFLEAEVVGDGIVSHATGRRRPVTMDILVQNALNIVAKISASMIRTLKMRK